MYDPIMRVLMVLEILQARDHVTGAELAGPGCAGDRPAHIVARFVPHARQLASLRRNVATEIESIAVACAAQALLQAVPVGAH